MKDIVEKISNTEIDVALIFKFIKAFFSFLQISFLGINTVKRELQFVLISLNIRKLIIKKTISIKIT